MYVVLYCSLPGKAGMLVLIHTEDLMGNLTHKATHIMQKQ